MQFRRLRRERDLRPPSGGNGSGSNLSPEYVHPLDATPASFEPTETTGMVPVGPGPQRRRDLEPEWPNEQRQAYEDLADSDAPVFAQDAMQGMPSAQADDYPQFVSHGRPRPRPPASTHDQSASEAEVARSAPWVSTSPSSQVVGSRSPRGAGSVTIQAGRSPAEVFVRIEVAIVDETRPRAPANSQQAASEAPKARRRSTSARAAIWMTGALVLVGIGLLLVQLGVWLAR